MHEYVTELILENAEATIDAKLHLLRDEYRKNGIPTLLTESLNELILFATIKQPKKILELGTSVGCSGIALLQSAKNAELFTVEKSAEVAKTASENFAAFGLSDRVKQYVGDAVEVINEVGYDFDFVFLDCNKSKYNKLYPEIKKRMVKGGILFADNVLFRGYITGEIKVPHRQNTIKNNMRDFLRLISSDTDMITTISDIGDGISVSYKR